VAGVSYTLLVDGLPADPTLLAAVQQVEVEEHAELADILRLRLAVGVAESGSEWTVVDEGKFERLTNLRLLVTVGLGLPETLVDAYVVETNAEFSSRPGESALSVVAMDGSVQMNQEEKVRAWPNMGDGDIATLIFAEYGLIPIVQPTQPIRTELDWGTFQRGTDAGFLRDLAKRNGCEFYVEANPLTGLPEGHFHPPLLDLPPQGVLTVNMGEASNVDRFSVRHDMLRPAAAQVTDLDIETHSDQTAQAASLSLTALGSTPTLGANGARTVLIEETGVSTTGELQTAAQAAADRSAWCVVAEGEVRAAAYEGILRARRPVLVRGAGRQFSGTYYVERVLHTITGEGYTQKFTLRRNAVGLTGAEPFILASA
jgi:phage protein D